MEIPCPVKPRISVLTCHVDYQRIPLPAAIRPAHPTIGGSLSRTAHVDHANSAGKLIADYDVLLRLDDLKGIGHVRGPRHARHITFYFRVQLQPIGSVLFLFGSRRRQIRNLLTLYHAETRRNEEGGAEIGPRSR